MENNKQFLFFDDEFLAHIKYIPKDIIAIRKETIKEAMDRTALIKGLEKEGIIYNVIGDSFPD